MVQHWFGLVQATPDGVWRSLYRHSYYKQVNPYGVSARAINGDWSSALKVWLMTRVERGPANLTAPRRGLNRSLERFLGARLENAEVEAERRVAEPPFPRGHRSGRLRAGTARAPPTFSRHALERCPLND